MGLKRILLLTMAAVLAIVLMPISAMADSEEPWEFEGGGWGHGIGLSQFGAKGMADAGKPAKEILQFYYQGTNLKDAPSHWSSAPNGLWVGLVSNTPSVNLSAVGGEIAICQPAGTCPPEPPYSTGFNDITISPDESWVFEVDQDDTSQCRFRKKGDDDGNLMYRECEALLEKADNTGVRFVVNGKQYARGTIRMTKSTAGFHVVVTLPMEEYLYGLAEVPSSWHMEALKAQAIIGRSFALATAHGRGGDDGSGKRGDCGCHIRSTTADQAYNGWAKESEPQYGQRWVAAVNETNGRILYHDKSPYFADVAIAFYSSSNGGASENIENAWPKAEPRPWLKSVEDPWSANLEINPLAKWSVKVSDSLMASYFGWDRALDAFKLQGPPDVLVRFTGKKNGQDVEAVLNGTQIATLLKKIGHGYEPVLGGNTSIRVSPYISSVTDPPGFDDTVGHTFEVAIDWMLDENITVGCNPPDNTRYCPDESVTRGQMAVFISRVLGLPSPAGDHFGDDKGKFYESAANRLYEAGITVGCADGRFCGDETMTRGQMAAFIIRALDDPPAASRDYFRDDDNSIFQKAINQMAESKITLGCNPPDNDRYCPGDDVTRGQMAAFFRRAWGP